MGLLLALRNLDKDGASMLNIAHYHDTHGRWTFLPIRGALRHDTASESLPAHIKGVEYRFISKRDISLKLS